MVLNDQFSVERARAVIEAGMQSPHVRYSILVLEECLERYNCDEVILSFNGGKDCTAVLHLAASVFLLRGIHSLTCLYVTGEPFPEVDAFVEKASQYYNLKVIRKKKPIKSALTALLNENKKLKAGLMGVRRGDPGSEKLQPFQPTDPSWPQLMRISPILDWTYRNVWDFLLEHEVPYCSLYDKGYTSLGERTKTFPNPLLQIPNAPSSYRPAYTLIDDSTERNGRG
ncbi:FAD synthase [Diachasma alloeum]|uniref:FAD synthase n=1 Tax=Diachasma alloeum TaxID=454923 RepID=UPI00073818AC|nr:FAD synthase [Diachasma alloeum]XP_028982340.1 FAD synthase [Diachasma alloeum]